MTGTSIPIRELQAKCSRIVHRVEQGESFTVTVHRRPVAQIIPMPRRRTVPFYVAIDLAANNEPIPRGEPWAPRMDSPNALLDLSLLDPDDPNPVLVHMVDLFEAEVSAITLGELTFRALSADDSNRTNRIAALSAVESRWDPLPVDAAVCREFGRLVAALRSQEGRVPDLKLLVAATALANDLSLVTRDSDYEVLQPLGLRLIHI
jgi:toxin FitB